MLILYYILPQKRIDSAAFLSVLKQLPISKKRQIMQLKNKRARLQSIIGLNLVKTGLQQLGQPNFHLKKLRFKNNKPYIRQKNYFSISHSQNCVCCAFSQNQPVGLDVEKIRSLGNSLIKKYQLSKKGVQPITCWTQKEAVLKVYPQDNLNEIREIQLYANTAKLKNRHYFIRSFKTEQHYTMSVATTQPITKLKIKRVYF